MSRGNRILAELIYRTGILETAGNTHCEVSGVVFDSRKVSGGSLFVAFRGGNDDGHRHIDSAIEMGAVAVVCEHMPEHLNKDVCYIRVEDSRRALGIIASNYYGNPSLGLALIGITGTNGKTTVAKMLHGVFSGMGYKCGLISTIGNMVHDKEVEARYTTPDAPEINLLLSQMLDAGCEYAFMEVSSHALAQSRVAGLSFAGAVFTNLTHDHLDYHKTFREYSVSKKILFDELGSGSFALTNMDDKNGKTMVQNTKARVSTYSIKRMADFRARILEKNLDGMLLTIDRKDVWCRLTGTFNAYNILAVYATGRILDLDSDSLLTAISKCGPPEGRLDLFRGRDGITGIVDYAHTPDALKNVMETISELRTGNEKFITVVGCGGNRDSTKRAPMAEIAARFSDKVIFTSDNPRFEEPKDIIKDMIRGLESNPALKSKQITVTDRREAIAAACAIAGQGDIILVAGKGHEKYQEIKGARLPFDDKAELKRILAA